MHTNVCQLIFPYIAIPGLMYLPFSAEKLPASNLQRIIQTPPGPPTGDQGAPICVPGFYVCKPAASVALTNIIQIGGLILAKERTAAGTLQIPSPQINPEAKAGA